MPQGYPKALRRLKIALKCKVYIFLDEIMREKPKKLREMFVAFLVFLCLKVSMSEEQDKNILGKF